MSMIVTTVVTEGIIMAADSACSMLTVMDLKSLLAGNLGEALKNSLSSNLYGGNGNTVGSHVTSRTFQKLHTMKGNNIAIAEGNEWVTRNTQTSIKPYLNYFCKNNHFDNPKTAAAELLKFVRQIDPSMDAKFHVCGYNPEGEIPMPEFWYVDVLENEARLIAGNGSGGICFCGANAYFSQYVKQINEKMIYYTLQDAVDVTMFAFDVAMKCERFIDLEQHITPPIDMLVITQDGIEWISKKKLGA